ncbi:MAG TPA: hypothetical protein VHL77_11560 [Ferruginibacter sp.]|nr:hypothetical protein [Ferruginibacter sp.]
MKNFTLILVVLCTPLFSFCQDITGLWKGTMFNDSTKQSLEYEIVISKEKGKLTGYSHTSYVINDKRFYGIKKLNIRIAKDGKIVMQDVKQVENNLPEAPNKNVIQLNVLDLANVGDNASLDGLFVTNRSKDYLSLSGKINMKRVNPLTQSELVQYLRKNNSEEILTAVK